MPSPRDIAFRTLLSWQRLDDPPFLPERTDEAWKTLTPRDRAFAFDLITGIFRWRNTLDAVIASRLRQPLESLDHPVRAVLWIGACQLLVQSGTADYAAVDTAVSLARRNKATAKAGGLVNAVLRGITRLAPRQLPRSAENPGAPAAATLSRAAFALDFSTDVIFNAPLFPDPSAAIDGHLAAVRSHPIAYVRHLRKVFGADRAGDLLLRNNLRPLITLRVDADSVDVPAGAGLAPHPGFPRFLIARDGWNPLIEQLVAAGTLSPQDPTAAKPVRFLAELIQRQKLSAPKRILDLCAGLGTKSVQLARTFPSAQVVATDVDDAKLARLQTRARQLKLTNLSTIPIGDLTTMPAADRPFDLVLLDVPCSNTGVMAKRVQSRWRWSSLDHGALHTLQRNLLAQGVAMAGPNGTALYSTCSIDPAENEQMIAAAIAAAPSALQLIHEESTLPSLANTPLSPHDGGYFAVLGKN